MMKIVYLLSTLLIFTVSCGDKTNRSLREIRESTTSTLGNEGCNCTTQYSPVCANGVQFTNSCTASCAGVNNFTSGECKNNNDGCICTQQYDPVCANNITYSNACSAQCKGITQYTQGACSI